MKFGVIGLGLSLLILLALTVYQDHVIAEQRRTIQHLMEIPLPNSCYPDDAKGIAHVKLL